MDKRWIILSLAFYTISCQPCVEGSGENVTDQRMVETFEGIHLKCAADVVIKDRVDPAVAGVVISAPQNILAILKTEVRNGTLYLDLEECVTGAGNIDIVVYAGELSNITNDGSGSIKGESETRAERIKIDNDGSGTIQLLLRAEEADIHNDGSGNVDVGGEAQDIDLKNTGSGSIRAMELRSEIASVSNQGSGGIEVYAEKKLDIKLNGSGDVRYGGQPPEYSQDDNGSGSIQKNE